MALAKQILFAACAGLCMALCCTAEGREKKSTKPETAQDRRRADAYGEEACDLALRGRYRNGLSMLDLLIRKNPQSASLYAWRARLLLEATFDRGAPINRRVAMKNVAADVARAQALDDSVCNIHLVLARLAIIDQNEEKALPELNKAVDCDPKCVSVRLLRSQLLEGEGKGMDALHDLDVAVKLNPSSETFSRRALARQHVCDYKGAIEDYSLAMKGGATSGLFVRRGETYELARQYEKAIADCRTALAMKLSKSEEVACRKRIARMLFDMKKYNDAAKEFSAILVLNPEDMPSIGKHLECVKKTKNWKVALADVNKLLDFESQYDGYYKERADIYRALGRADLAAADDKRYTELHKKMSQPLRYN